MNFPHVYWMYFTAAIAVLAVACAFVRGSARRLMGNALLLLLTAFVATFLGIAFGGHKLGKTNGVVAADEAEMQLRVVSMISSFSDTAMHKLGGAMGASPPPPSKPPAEQLKAQASAYTRAETSLRTAIKQNPASELYKVKLIVLLGEEGASEHRGEIGKLIDELAAVHDQDASSAGIRHLAAVFQDVYGKGHRERSQVDAGAETIKTVLAPGWYRDKAIERLYSAAGANQLYEDYSNRVKDRSFGTMLNLIGIGILMVVCGIVGVVTMFVQLALQSREQDAHKQPSNDAVGLTIPLRLVYAVFISWFALQLIVSFIFHYVSAKIPWMSTEAFPIALSTFLTYLLSNLPGPLLIWYLALKPSGYNFWQALKVRMRTETAGPPKLFGAGLLGWCCAIPLVVTTALIAQALLKVQGSDNPVLGQIMQAATASSLPATIVFYLTLGVLAPIFEETLFRGFIYASLKPRIGSGLAIIASAALFATMHFDRGGLLSLFAIGVVLAFLFERTRSILPSMICHGLWNSGTFTFALIIFSS